MVERLKESYYRRRFGADRAALIKEVEEKLATLPPTDETRRATKNLWAGPPGAWLEYADVLICFYRWMEIRESVVGVITQKNALLRDNPGTTEADETCDEVERVRIACREAGEEHRNRVFAFRDKWRLSTQMGLEFLSSEEGPANTRPTVSKLRKSRYVAKQLKRLKYRRRYGRTPGDLIFRAEQGLRSIPAGLLSSDQMTWIWKQPPEAWPKIVQAWKKGETYPGEPLPRVEIDPEEFRRVQEQQILFAQKVVDNVKRILTETQTARTPDGPAHRPSLVENARLAFEEGAIEAAKRVDRLQSTIKTQRLAPSQFQIRLQTWVDNLPAEAQEEGTKVAALMLIIADARNELHLAVYEEQLGIGTDNSTQIASTRAKLEKWDAEYTRLAQPFFARYGKPEF